MAYDRLHLRTSLTSAQLSLLLAPDDACSLLQSCSRSLKQDVRDAIATEALLYYYKFDGVHFGDKCPGISISWCHRVRAGLVALVAITLTCEHTKSSCQRSCRFPICSTRGRRYSMPCVCSTKGSNPTASTCCKSCGARSFGPPRCSQSCSPSPRGWKWSVSETPERRASARRLSTAALTRLMDVVDPGFGSQFFSSSNAEDQPKHVLEAHWRGIEVDSSSGSTSCQFCEHYDDSPLFARNQARPPPTRTR